MRHFRFFICNSILTLTGVIRSFVSVPGCWKDNWGGMMRRGWRMERQRVRYSTKPIISIACSQTKQSVWHKLCAFEVYVFYPLWLIIRNVGVPVLYALLSPHHSWFWLKDYLLQLEGVSWLPSCPQRCLTVTHSDWAAWSMGLLMGLGHQRSKFNSTANYY